MEQFSCSEGSQAVLTRPSGGGTFGKALWNGSRYEQRKEVGQGFTAYGLNLDFYIDSEALVWNSDLI
jgi:hypothetical protein